ncbi:MAG: GtrA family protein [Candidatus Yanofskybacteria bacterium]|nr:GtrA family protein [Candidatus Yanofskybacteria bacterium]
MTQLKKDLLVGLILGFLSSIFLIFIIQNPQIEEFRQFAVPDRALWFLPLIMATLFGAGIAIAFLLGKIVRVVYQFTKFGTVGVLNTLIDFGILNLLIWITGITGGLAIVPLNALSFFAATTNSYFWNKFWVFSKKTAPRPKEFLQFVIISTVGIGINTGIVYAGTTFAAPLFDLSSGAWVNAVKLAATFAAMFWNFLGYKLVVFKK